MAMEFVQSKTGGEVGEIVRAVLDTVPVEGNLLVAVMPERGTSNPPTSDEMISTGWTRIGYQRVDGADTTYRRAMALYYKFAGSAESQTVDGTYDPSIVNYQMTVLEFSGVGAFKEIVWADNGPVSDETVMVSGDQVTTAAACLIVISHYKMNNTAPGPLSSVDMDYTNDFIFCHKGYIAVWGFISAVSYAEKSTAGTHNTQTTISATSTLNVGIHIASLEFETVGGEEPTPTDSPAIMGASF